ncbi:MAG TPA: acyl-CoA dehydrogenase [Gammaproteobacteria bacterium]|nr:acyl-CoA dehydrogenase [Gammaproteobacteria bacterium]
MLFNIIILAAAVLGLACIQAPIKLWTLLLGITLLLVSIFGKMGFIALTFCWLLFILIALFANLKNLRQKYIIHPFIRILQKRIPSISQTEQEAIEAGDVWWEKDLFCGRPQWKKFLAIPGPKLTLEEQAFLDNQVETLCGMLNDWEIVNNENNMPKEVWDYLRQEKFFAMIIPKEYGGHGFSAFAHSTVIMKIATRSLSVAINMMVPNALGPAELLLHYGTTEQKEYYLPKLAKGEEIPCFALTAPEAGSDADAITDSGIICYGEHEGKEILGIRLNWNKRYITLAPVATVLGLAFRLYDPDHLIGKEQNLGVTLCLVPTSHPGVEIGNRHVPLFMAFLNGPTSGKDVFVPIEWIIGGPVMAGQGWKMLMECLSMGRGISLPALSTACGKMTYRIAGAYARLRRQFNTPIAHFEGVEEVLGNIAGSAYLLEATRILTAGAVDLNIKPAIATAIAKYHMTEIARQAISHAMDVHAGHGIQMGPRNLLAIPYIAMPISITVEGANILTRNLIIFGQGAIRCHPYVLQEIEMLAMKDSPQKTDQLDKLLLSHMGYTISNFARNIIFGLTAGKCIFAPKRSPVARYYRKLTRMSAAFALVSDMTMLILGGKLKRKERISARLGDILSQLYLASAVLKYFEDHGQPKSDINYVKWCVEKCLFEIQHAIDELLNNYPSIFLGKILRWIIFPFGTAYRKPKDNLSHKIVSSMIEPSAFRDRLTKYFYETKNQEDPAYQMETALKMSLPVDPVWKKFQNALRNDPLLRQGTFEEQLKNAALNAEEIALLKTFNALTEEVIKVSEFSFDLNTIVN